MEIRMSIFNTKYFDGVLDFIEKNYYIFLMAILLMSALNIFYNIGKAPINSWDEARHGVNAYEMIKRNNYIVNTYSYKNDYWNLKSPISYWAIIMGYKLMGFNPSGLRIVLSVSAYLTILMYYWGLIIIGCLYLWIHY
jgi:4-amino-4-deoxy-L-arabinose transferase-like glycosyltransferase